MNTKKGEGHIIVVGASPLDSAGKPIVLLGRCLDIDGVLYLKFQESEVQLLMLNC